MQGMSDLLSPLLVTMMDEAHAYVCFCALMQRLKKNFMVDGQAMTKMFQHLSEGLMYYDPEFFAYLKINQADDLLFCYRWLLLEMKREFAFEDSLQVNKVMYNLPRTRRLRFVFFKFRYLKPFGHLCHHLTRPKKVSSYSRSSYAAIKL